MSRVFLSYAHADNDDSRPWVEWLKDALQAELRRHTGVPWDVFLDTDGIDLGRKWRDVVGNGVASSAFFVCLISPSYFNSQICRDELSSFAETEARLGRDDLIIPLKVFPPRPQQSNDPLVQLCLGRQYDDYEAVRLMQLGNEVWLQKVKKLAVHIVRAYDRGTPLTVRLLSTVVTTWELAVLERDAIDAGALRVDSFTGDGSRYQGPFEVLTRQAAAGGIATVEEFVSLRSALEKLVPAATQKIGENGHRIAAVAEDLLTVALGLHSSMNGRPSIRWHDLFTPDLAVSLTKVCREAAPAQARRQP